MSTALFTQIFLILLTGTLLTRLWLARPPAPSTLCRRGAFLIMALLDLPASIYQTFVIEQRFGFNHSTPALFVADLLKQTLLLFALGAPLALAALWLMQSAGTLWWFYLWLLWSGFTLLMIWAYPTVIAPLFNKFTPLKNRSVQTRIQALLG